MHRRIINASMNNIKLGYIDNDDRLCTTLRLLRLQSAMSLSTAGAGIGMSASNLNNIEHGVTRMSTDTLFKLLNIYGVHLILEEAHTV